VETCTAFCLCYTGQIDGLRAVRPVTPVRPVDRAGQVGGYRSRTTNVPESLNDFSRPWNRNTPKTQPARKKNPSQSRAKTTPNRPRIDQQQHSPKTQDPSSSPDKSHKGLAPIRPVRSTGQTGGAWAARDEQSPRVNSSKSNSRSPNSLHGFVQDFGDIVGTPHGHSIAKLWSIKTH
jgi:hypothetical protein